MKLSVLGILALTFIGTLSATQVGEILVCYTCQNTGNSAIDAALGTPAGQEVAGDGILFAFVNTSASSITGGTFSVTDASPDDSFAVPTIAAGSTFILIPGATSDGGTHPAAGLFALTGVMDTSDGDGGVTDSSIFKFAGLDGGLAVSSVTAGTSTGIPGTFTSGDPGLFMPYRDNPSAGTISFILAMVPAETAAVTIAILA